MLNDFMNSFEEERQYVHDKVDSEFQDYSIESELKESFEHLQSLDQEHHTLSMCFEDLETLYTSIESTLQEKELTPYSAHFLHLAVKSCTYPLSVESHDLVPSIESFTPSGAKVATKVSLEGVGHFILKIIAAISNVLRSIRKAVVKFFKLMFGALKRLRKKVDKVIAFMTKQKDSSFKGGEVSVNPSLLAYKNKLSKEDIKDGCIGLNKYLNDKIINEYFSSIGILADHFNEIVSSWTLSDQYDNKWKDHLNVFTDNVKRCYIEDLIGNKRVTSNSDEKENKKLKRVVGEFKTGVPNLIDKEMNIESNKVDGIKYGREVNDYKKVLNDLIRSCESLEKRSNAFEKKREGAIHKAQTVFSKLKEIPDNSIRKNLFNTFKNNYLLLVVKLAKHTYRVVNEVIRYIYASCSAKDKEVTTVVNENEDVNASDVSTTDTAIPENSESAPKDDGGKNNEGEGGVKDNNVSGNENKEDQRVGPEEDIEITKDYYKENGINDISEYGVTEDIEKEFIDNTVGYDDFNVFIEDKYPDVDRQLRSAILKRSKDGDRNNNKNK